MIRITDYTRSEKVSSRGASNSNSSGSSSSEQESTRLMRCLMKLLSGNQYGTFRTIGYFVADTS